MGLCFFLIGSSSPAASPAAAVGPQKQPQKQPPERHTFRGFDDDLDLEPRFLSRGAGFRPPGTGINIDPLDVAEGLAHANIAQKYGVHFACVAGPCRMPPVAPAKCDILNNWAPIFVITRFATDGTYDTGFSFTKEERATWMDTRRPCQFVG